jgi:hypothetical protein
LAEEASADLRRGDLKSAQKALVTLDISTTFRRRA